MSIHKAHQAIRRTGFQKVLRSVYIVCVLADASIHVAVFFAPRSKNEQLATSILETRSELRIASAAPSKMSDSRHQYSRVETRSELRTANQSAAPSFSSSFFIIIFLFRNHRSYTFFLYCIASLVFASFKAMLLILFLLRLFLVSLARKKRCLANIAVAACFYRSLLCKTALCFITIVPLLVFECRQ